MCFNMVDNFLVSLVLEVYGLRFMCFTTNSLKLHNMQHASAGNFRIKQLLLLPPEHQSDKSIYDVIICSCNIC